MRNKKLADYSLGVVALGALLGIGSISISYYSSKDLNKDPKAIEYTNYKDNVHKIGWAKERLQDPFTEPHNSKGTRPFTSIKQKALQEPLKEAERYRRLTISSLEKAISKGNADLRQLEEKPEIQEYKLGIVKQNNWLLSSLGGMSIIFLGAMGMAHYGKPN